MNRNIFLNVFGILAGFVSLSILILGIRDQKIELLEAIVIYILWLIFNLLSVFVLHRYKFRGLAFLTSLLTIPLAFIGLRLLEFGFLHHELAISMVFLYSAITAICYESVFAKKS